MPNEYKQLDFAKAERGPIAHLWGNSNWCAEEKCDGWRLQFHLGNPCSRLYAFTRGGEEVGLNLPQLTPHVNIDHLQYTVLDGELVPIDGKEFHSLAGVRAGKIDGVAYKVFDALWINGLDVRGLPLEKRLELVNAVLGSLYLGHTFVKPVKRAFVDTYAFLIEQLAAGGEGVVLKDLHSTYGNNWLKAKKVSTFDTIIVGIEPGYHTPHGKVHLAVCDGLNLRDVGKCGIQIAEVRAALNKNPNDFLGRVAEVQALKIDSTNGLLREPRFVRMRFDMSPLEATWEKLNRDAMKIELE